MNYKIPDRDKVDYIDGENSVEKVKATLLSFLELNSQEKDALETIHTNKDLLSLVNTPEAYFTENNVKAFSELKELMDLLGGIYYA